MVYDIYKRQSELVKGGCVSIFTKVLAPPERSENGKYIVSTQ